jgi:beta-N-acetylhexosaminidase
MTTSNNEPDRSPSHLYQQSQEQSKELAPQLVLDQQSGASHSEQIVQRAESKRHRLHPLLLVSLVLLAVIVTLAGIFGFRLFTRGMPAARRDQPTSASFSLSSPGAAGVDAHSHPSLYEQYKQLASLYVSHMTLDEELGQLIMVEYNEASYSPDLDTMITKLHAGGVILYEFQIQTAQQIKHDVAEMQKHAFLPLLISTDEEGGPFVHRLANIDGLRMSAAEIARTGNPQVAMQQGQKTAQDLLTLGMNENLAPDVDVNIRGSDMFERTFGNTAQSVITFAGAYLKGLQGSGVVGCIKHFPGLGAATTDAHTTLPVVNRTKAQLDAVELAPFKAFIQSSDQLDQPGMIMSTDVLMPAIDAHYPAELSHTFMTDILRKEFGYDGVAVTDSLYMQGIARTWNLPDAAVLALNAGNDMLLGPVGAKQTIAVLNALKSALQNGTLAKARVDEAATRIIALKMEYHLMPAAPPQF